MQQCLVYFVAYEGRNKPDSAHCKYLVPGRNVCRTYQMTSNDLKSDFLTTIFQLLFQLNCSRLSLHNSKWFRFFNLPSNRALSWSCSLVVSEITLLGRLQIPLHWSHTPPLRDKKPACLLRNSKCCKTPSLKEALTHNCGTDNAYQCTTYVL